MRRLFSTLFLLVVVFVFAKAVSGESKARLSVLDFGSSPIGKRAADNLRASIREIPDIQLIDEDLSKAAARGIGYEGSLNLSVLEAKNLGAVLESDFYIIGDSQTLRRSSSSAPIYYESYSSVFLISSRSGKLLFWNRPSFHANSPVAAEDQLIKLLSDGELSQRCLVAIRRAQEDERQERILLPDSSAPLIEEAPDDDKTVLAQGLRLPRPYRRLRPVYPESAALAEAEATVDVVVDVGADGEVKQVRIARWAGFGLDDSTISTVRQMHFFPAMRDGTAIPMRVLLRYNFRKPAQ
jgi:TonB family protein